MTSPSARIALVTGASRGIGRALALGLARRGAHVVALARTQGRAGDPIIRRKIAAAAGLPMHVVNKFFLRLDGKIDDPGAAIIDAAWPKLADAVLTPVLGSLTDRLAALMERDDAPNPNGSSFIDGWYGYVVKDLSTLLGQKVAAPYANQYCGAGDATTCSQDLWAALDAAGAQLQAAQGADPSAWRSDATAERIQFAPGFLPVTMRWTNRPTYQQILVFDGHR